jgi:hypothetical protein
VNRSVITRPDSFETTGNKAAAAVEPTFMSVPGLPDGFFSDQKIPLWVYFGGPWNGKC